MSKLLIINAHPEVESTSSFSLNTFKHFLEVYKKEHSKDEVIEQINLYKDVVPMIDQTVIGAWNKLRKGQELTSQEKEVTERMNEVLKQFKSANKYVIVYPLHNFNVPSKLKDYIDNIMIARETFKYTENGPVGLLQDGRSMVIIQASGSIYSNNDWYSEVEHSNKYLKTVFNLFGINDYEIIRVEGTAFLDKEEILKKAYKEVEEVAFKLAIK